VAQVVSGRRGKGVRGPGLRRGKKEGKGMECNVKRVGGGNTPTNAFKGVEENPALSTEKERTI